MRRSFDRWMIGAAGIVGLLILTMGLAIQSKNQLREHAYWVANSHQIIRGLEKLLSLCKDAQSGQRGYLITADEAYLERFNSAQAVIEQQLVEVETLIDEDSPQRSSIPRLRREVYSHLGILNELVSLQKKGEVEAARALMLTGQGRVAMNELGRTINELSQDAQTVLNLQNSRVRATYRSMLVTDILIGLTAIASVIAFVVLLRRSLRSALESTKIIGEQAERLGLSQQIGNFGSFDWNIVEGTNSWTPELESLYGLGRGEFPRTQAGWEALVHPDDRAATVEVVNKALQTGEPMESEWRVTWPDGQVRWLAGRFRAFMDADGKPVRLVGVNLDITDRKSAETARGFLGSIVQNSQDAIVSKDLNGIITSWNVGAEKLFGYSADEVIGHSVNLLIPPERLAEERDILAHIRRGERVDHFETIRLRKDGSPVHISLTISPVRDDSGRIIGASKIARDITERRKADEALLEADRRKNEFLAMLAHELRNPLAPIANAVEMLKLRLGSDASEMDPSEPSKPMSESIPSDTFDAKPSEVLGGPLGSTVGMIERQIGQLVRLVDDLLDVSRISRGKIDLRCESVELSAIINLAVEASKPLCERLEHQLRVTLPAYPVYLKADPTRLAQVFGNLLNNACKFSAKGGLIELDLRLEPDPDLTWVIASGNTQRTDFAQQAVIRVRDTGIGIAPENIPRIFDMFMQVDTSLGRTTSGLGIGLTLVKTLVEMHGGSISVHSDGIGQGTEFVVRLPVQPENAFTETDLEKSPIQRQELPRRRIVIVDDTRANALMLGRLLEAMNQQVEIFCDAESAYEWLCIEPADIVISDLYMPNVSGIEFARKIRSDAKLGSLKLLALSGLDSEQHRDVAIQAGFDDFLTKPADREQLHRVLASIPTTNTPFVVPRRVLVVDDNVDSALSLTMLLELAGHHVRSVHDGLSAVEAASTFQPDVIFLDIGLPNLNGYEAAERIRSLPNAKRVILVALTGWGQLDDRRRSEQAGFDLHLVKPVDPGVLSTLLNDLEFGKVSLTSTE